MADAHTHADASKTQTASAIVQSARVVAISWHGVLFDAGRREIHEALRAAFRPWGVDLHDDELEQTRGPTGAPQIRRLLSLQRVAEAFRSTKARWANADDIAAIARDLEPRLIEAAARAATPNQDAVELLQRLHDRGVQTAVICCTPKRLLGPQLAQLERAGLPLDAVVTADEACEPAPAPWGIFEVMRLLGVQNAHDLVFIDDSDAGWLAAKNAGARSLELASGTIAGRANTGHADASTTSLRDV
jgi:beta-phosphoglucomutase-like phosphatase (HAD superfamily)